MKKCKGLMPEDDYQKALKGYPTALVCFIRAAIVERVTGLTEKFNPKQRYFGYCVKNDSDKAYIYVQKKKLVIDLCIDQRFAKEIEGEGFAVRPRDNFQYKARWLTGWEVPQSTLNIGPIIKYFCEAFK